MDKENPMKLQKFIFTYLILFVSFQICFAQEKPKSVLIDDFNRTNCDALHLKIDNLGININDSPNSKGYILINGDKKDFLVKYFYEREIKAVIRFRKIPTNQIVILYGKDEDNFRTQFWIVPDGADKPAFTEEKWDYKLPPNTEAFIVKKDSWIGEVCFASYDINFYSKVLLASPDFKGHLVIYNKSANKFYQKEKQLLRELISKNKVPRQQLKFFYVKSKTPDVEYWFVPRTKNELWRTH